MTTRLVFIASLMMDLDQADEDVLRFSAEFPATLVAGIDDQLNAKLLLSDQIDGSNGGGGDGRGERLSFRISESQLTAQRWLSSPVPFNGGTANGAFRNIKFPPTLTAQLCFIFETRTDYEAHMSKHKSFYQRYFAYSITLMETPHTVFTE